MGPDQGMSFGRAAAILDVQQTRRRGRAGLRLVGLIVWAGAVTAVVAAITARNWIVLAGLVVFVIGSIASAVFTARVGASMERSERAYDNARMQEVIDVEVAARVAAIKPVVVEATVDYDALAQDVAWAMCASEAFLSVGNPDQLHERWLKGRLVYENRASLLLAAAAGRPAIYARPACNPTGTHCTCPR